MVASLEPEPLTAHRLTAAFWLASALFLLSGASGLAYEVIWFKRFSHVWGNSTLAMAAVVGPFLLGLGAGAFTIGRLADRMAVPLVGYGWCEAGVGLLALFVPAELRGLELLASLSYPVLQDHLLLHSLVRCLLALLVLGPPCFLMGGSLPLLVRQFSPTRAALRDATAWLYAVNTLGAAAGCYLTGFHLLPAIGLRWGNLLAVAVNLLVAAVAIVAGRWLPFSPAGADAATEPPDAGSEAAPRPPLPRLGLDAIVALSGCAALMLQVVWARQLALILGGSTYAFSAMLFVILLGIAFGSTVARALLSRALDARAIAALLTALLVVTVAAGQRAIPNLTYLVALARPLRASQTLNGLLSMGASAGLELLPSLAMGLLFPLFVSLAADPARQAGRTVGEIFAWNTAGTMIGAFVTSTVLIPRLGTANTVILASCLYAASIVLLVPRDAWYRPCAQWAALALAGAAMWLGHAPADPRITNSGMYMYGYMDPQSAVGSRQVAYFKEGASANVLVLEERGGRSLRVNGKADASDNPADMRMQLGLAYYPRFLHPQAKNVLVIGFGSGTTTGASLLFPGAEVHCVELEPAVFAASSSFARFNHSPEGNARFTITFDDGRSFVQGSAEQFDLIDSEPSNPWMAGISNLFTQEFYQAARRRLKPGGILTQWVQTYNSTSADYAMIARTMMSVFPHTGLIRISDGDTLLLASDSPLEPTAENVRQAQALVDALPPVKADLEAFFDSSDVLSLLVQYLVLDDDGMRRMVTSDTSQGLNTDWTMRLEFDAPRALFQDDTRGDVEHGYLAAADPAHVARLFDTLNGSKAQASVFHRVAVQFVTTQLVDPAREVVELGLQRDPQRFDLVGSQLGLSPPTDPDAIKRAVAAVLTGPESYANALGVYLWQNRKYPQAAAVFDGLATRHPTSPIAWKNLASSYVGAGQRDKALQAYERAIALDPLDDNARKSYEQLQSTPPAPGGSSKASP